MNRNILKAYAASFLKNLQFFGPISVPYFLDWLRVDYTRMFILQAWFLFWVFILEVPTGVVADKFGRKMSVAIGCLLFAADMLFFGLSRNYYLLFAAEFLGAVGMTLISGADQALLYDSLVALKIGGPGPILFFALRGGRDAGASHRIPDRIVDSRSSELSQPAAHAVCPDDTVCRPCCGHVLLDARAAPG